MRHTVLFIAGVSLLGCGHESSTMPSHSARTAAEPPLLANDVPSNSADRDAQNLGQPQPAQIRKDDPGDGMAAMAVPTAGAPDSTPESAEPPSRAEAALRARVQEALLESNALSYTAKHVRVDVEKQDVTLRGDVRTARERTDVERVVEKLQGVRQVKNQLAVVNQNPTETNRNDADRAARSANAN